MKIKKIIGTSLVALCICSALSFSVFAAENTEASEAEKPETVTVTVLEEGTKEVTKQGRLRYRLYT